MKEFAYVRAASTDEALQLIDNDQTRYLAGGTNLVDLMKLGVERPELLVDITGLVDDGIGATEEDGLRIGAGARNSDLAADPDVRSRFPVLSEALLAGASGQLRNLATVGGNLLQGTRCSYFQDTTKPCNRREPGTGCPARSGEHHNLAILGASEHCIATHPSDMAVALAALDATVQVQTTAGANTYSLDELYGTDPVRPHALPSGALITAVHIPPVQGRSHYRKVRERASYAFAIASVAAVLDVSGGVVRDVRLAFGAVAPRPWRARTAEAAMRGQAATESTFRHALEQEFAEAEPLRDNAYKVGLSATIALRTLEELS